MKLDIRIPKFNFDIPKYNVKMPKFEIPKIEPPELQFLQTRPKVPSYEDTMFFKMAEDMKASYEKQLNEITAALNEQLSLAKAEASSAKKEALLSKLIAVASLLFSIAMGVLQIFL